MSKFSFQNLAFKNGVRHYCFFSMSETRRILKNFPDILKFRPTFSPYTKDTKFCCTFLYMKTSNIVYFDIQYVAESTYTGRGTVTVTPLLQSFVVKGVTVTVPRPV